MPLEIVLAYLKMATESDDLPDGLPIYVDSEGLRRAGRTLDDTVAFGADDISISMALSAILRDLGLIWELRDGVIVITDAPR